MTDSRKIQVYVVDTNILINFSVWIPIKLNKFFWSFMEDSLKDGKWVLLDIVVNEIQFDIDLVAWCQKQKRNGLVRKISIDDRKRGIEINRDHPMIDQATMKSETDTYLIAYAERNAMVVFSREGFKKPTETLFKIPDVCKILKIFCFKKPQKYLDAIGFSN